MLSLGGFPPACNTTHHHTISQFLPFSSKTHQTHLSFLSDGLTHLNFCPVLHQIPTKFCVSALKSRSGGRGDNNRLLEMEDFDDDFEDDDDDEDEEMFVPLMNMKSGLRTSLLGLAKGECMILQLKTTCSKKCCGVGKLSLLISISSRTALKCSCGSTSRSSTGHPVF